MASSLSPCGMSSARISTCASTISLDIELLIGPPPNNSIMSESMTVCSLPSMPSGDLPEFAARKLPAWRMIGLGDRLKMFSSPEGPQTEDGNKNSDGSVSISIPTSPRLRTMLKECLSISKWAESSTTWHPPGHVPWESVHGDKAVPWVPEGSLFCSEYLSAALLRSRQSHRGIKSRPNAYMSSPESAAVATPSVPFTDQDSIDAELISMMQELRSIRKFFQSPESSDEIVEDALSIPSLVVSTSNFTLPMSPESSSSSTPVRSNSLASRRGKKVPPALLLHKGRSTTDLSYPGIPTAFLGSPSHHIPKVVEAKKKEKSSLDFEDMINNLRLQCSTMALQTPPSDPALNSRSSPEFMVTNKHVASDEWSFANGLIKEKGRSIEKNPLPRMTQRNRHCAESYGTRTANADPRTTVAPKTTKPTKTCEKQAVSPSATNISKANERQTTLPRSTGRSKATGLSKANEKAAIPDVRSGGGVSSIPSSQTSSPGKPRPSEPLRPAIVKFDSSRTLRSSKSVRFFIPRQELLKQVPIATPVSLEEVASQEGQPALPNLNATATSIGPNSQIELKDQIVQSTTVEPVLSRKSSKIGRALATTPLSRVREKATATIRAPLQPSIPSLGSGEPKVEGLTKSSSRMSVHSLGRHSFNRIMNVPLFTSKDKRATLSSIPFIPVNDENTARRGEEGVPSVSKKSRMPVPLRNIFTRFK